MSYMVVFGQCVACARPIHFNPDRVPSLRVAGQREPLCRMCFDRWNQIHRVAKGLAPLLLDPQAYEAEEVG